MVRAATTDPCVVPRRVEAEAIGELLSAIAQSGTGSFLAVLKTFGDRPPVGLLSFPMGGTTLSLDFPNLGNRTMRLFERLNSIVLAAGGRLYPAKDACMTRELLSVVTRFCIRSLGFVTRGFRRPCRAG